ncbi:outer membrane beta-barrel protein [Kiritimatiellaeota bacterium B1221]|nr:outer membrane beta-barrel protein [Kiritimatiellaeota bacterium B1221]
MRQITRLALGLFISSSFYLSAKDLPLDISNYLRVEYDDNVFTTGDGEGTEPVESFVLVEQIEFLLDSQAGNTYYGLRYIPTFKYYENRPDDDTDINNQLDVILNHDFTPRTSAQLKYSLRQADEPELVEDDVSFRNNNDYIYNSVNLDVITQVVPEKTSLKASGRYVDFAYDDDQVAETSDYSEATGGFDIIQVLQPTSNLAVQFRYTDVDYTADYRDAETLQGGLSFSKVLNPKLDGEIRLGYESHDPSDVVSQDTDSPYGNLTLRYQPLKGRRFTLGLGYAQAKSAVSTFSMQERFTANLSYANDLTASLTFTIGGTYAMGDYSMDNTTSLFDPAVNTDGDEETIYLSTSLDYNINVRNAMVLSYQYSDLDSDVRSASDYDRNRISLGWKYSL